MMQQHKVGMISLGCAKNLVDSERMLGALKEAGYVITNRAEEAHVLLVNTCAFIESAREESIEAILDASRYKEEGQCQVLVVTGCLSQRYGEELVRELPEVDAFAPIRAAGGIVKLVGTALKGERLHDQEHYGLVEVDRLSRVLATPSHTAYLRLADGCDNRCSYCAIPAIRGSLESRPVEDIVKEARQLAEDGVQELVLIAQDTTAYGHDRADGEDLGVLIRQLGQVEVPWVRVMYAHPAHLTAATIQAMSESPNCLAYLDLPLQHASDRILKAMNRPEVEKNWQAIERLRSYMPDITLRTTFLVGFPGETQGDFSELLAFVEEVGFDHLGAFTYSPEEDTPAIALPGAVPSSLADERLHRVMAVQQEIVAAKNRGRIGKVYPVLLDRIQGEGLRLGRAPHQAPETDGWVLVQRSHHKVGRIIEVQITGSGTYDLTGRVAPSGV